MIKFRDITVLPAGAPLATAGGCRHLLSELHHAREKSWLLLPCQLLFNLLY